MDKNKKDSAGSISNDAVEKATGKGWVEWFRQIDEAGGMTMSHREIVNVLKENSSLNGWWRQMVTVSYEQARGKREKHEKPEGYQISKSRTYPVPLHSLQEAWMNGEMRQKWLSRPDFRVTTVNRERSFRFRWEHDPTICEVQFYPVEDVKTRVTVQQSKLPDGEQAENRKQFWSEQLDRLGEFLREKYP